MLNFSKYRKEEKNDEFLILKTLKTPSSGRLLARALLIIGAIFFLFLFLPWQQNIRGTGEVTAFTPQDRPQTVESAIAGRIINWMVREGELVQAGDTILQLAEIKDEYFDPNLLERIREQMEAKQASILSKKEKAEALRNQINALRNAYEAKTEQAENKILQSRLKVISDSVDFQAQQIRYANVQSQYERNRQLYEAGNIALTKIQDLESKLQESRMKLISAENKFLESKAELSNAITQINVLKAEYLDKISKAESDLNATLSELFDAEGEYSKIRNKYANMLIRNQQYQVVAPQTGYIVRTLKTGIGETVKEGEAIVEIMPKSPEMAVEMYVDAMDIPLITVGRQVRLQFDGWPAIQFSGWPSVSVGTFGGVVRVIDYVGNKQGKFRLLITPDPSQEPWPVQIRFSSGVKGWVMLDTVPVWYEIWRQLNGFPPSLYEDPHNEGIPADEKVENKSKSTVIKQLGK